MLGGVNNSLFLEAFGGFIVIPVFILFLRWAFPSKKNKVEVAHRKAVKKSLKALKRR